MSPARHDGSIARLTGPRIDGLGLELRAARVRERLGRLTETTVEFVCKDPALDLGAVVGVPMRIAYYDENQEERSVSGLCVSAEYLRDVRQGSLYSAEVRPWLWTLTQTRDSRIFQDTGTAEILKDVLTAHGYWGDVELRLSGASDARPYCVQYRESDFAFLSRLMEEDGLHYLFEYGAGPERMVITDDSGTHPKVYDQGMGDDDLLPFHPRARGIQRPVDHVFEWAPVQRITPGRVTLDDYDFERPQADQTAARVFAEGPHDLGPLEIYDHPGRMRGGAFGAMRAGVRLEAGAARMRAVRGACNVRVMAAGRTFRLDGHPRVEPREEFLAIAATHDIAAGDHYAADADVLSLAKGGLSDLREGDAGATDEGAAHGFAYRYLCTFEAIPKAVPFRTPQETPRPEIAGLQTAVVTGPAGEEIHTDRHGRIKVQFHWDRLGEKDDKTTCWVRCVMPWTGKGWGMFAIPRIGQEVAIQFEEGDPDRPVCTGMLYNAGTMPPHAFPANKTQTGIVTRSTKDGGAGTFNELVFEDKLGEEFVRVQSEKDWMQTIKNDATITIGLEKKDGGDLTQTIHRHKTETLKTGDHTFRVEDGDQTVFVRRHHKETIEGTATQTIRGHTKQTVTTGDLTRKVSKGDESVTVEMGDYSLETALGEITLTAMKKITLKVGQSSIVLDPTGITMKAMNIKSEAQIKLDAKGLMTTVKGDTKLTLQGLMTDVKGDAMLICKGGLVMIN